MDIMKKDFTIRIADLVIELHTISSRTCILCMDYLQNDTPDIQITVSKEDVEREFLDSGFVRRGLVSIENAAAYRLIAEKVLDYGIILMHGAVIAVDGVSYMFSAPSGVGKTTHVKLWLQNVKDSYVVNGDKPLIKIKNDVLIACGTPWAGNEHMYTNTMVPLKSIIFLERSDKNHIERIPFSKAYPYLIQQSYIPKNTELGKKALELLSNMYGKVSFWQFKCNNFQPDCFATSYDALVNQK